MPFPEFTDIALITYDSRLNFYNIPKDLSNDLQLVVVCDLEDPYCPLPKETLFLNVLNDREKVI
jgi:protein transport protein SEC24